jgi:antirestriction protein ArdC
MKNQNVKIDVYEKITNIIIEKLEQGVAPWQCPFNRYGLPKNYESGKHYRGINSFLLNFTGKTPYYLTFLQAKELKGNVKKGAKGFPVIYYNFVEKEGENAGDEAKKIPFLKYYTVFSVDDVEGIEFDIPEGVKTANEKIEACEQIVKLMPNAPSISEYIGRAYYSPIFDEIKMPEITEFSTGEEYYATLFHELAHSTGHKNRLNRPELTEMSQYGDYNYSKEELTAEMTASFLCGFAGIDNGTLDNSAAYIDGWLKVLKGDKKFIIDAANKAQKAADYILDVKFEN